MAVICAPLFAAALIASCAYCLLVESGDEGIGYETETFDGIDKDEGIGNEKATIKIMQARTIKILSFSFFQSQIKK